MLVGVGGQLVNLEVGTQEEKVCELLPQNNSGYPSLLWPPSLCYYLESILFFLTAVSHTRRLSSTVASTLFIARIFALQ